MPVASWFDDMSDTELHDLIPFFEKLSKVDNVYTVLRNVNANHTTTNASTLQQQQQQQLLIQQQQTQVCLPTSPIQIPSHHFQNGATPT